MRRNREEEARANMSPAWGVIGGILALAAWASALLWSGEFTMGGFWEGLLVIVLVGFVIFSVSFSVFALAGGERDWFNRVLYLLGGIGINAFLIWKFFF